MKFHAEIEPWIVFTDWGFIVSILIFILQQEERDLKATEGLTWRLLGMLNSEICVWGPHSTLLDF